MLSKVAKFMYHQKFFCCSRGNQFQAGLTSDIAKECGYMQVVALFEYW